MPDTDERELAEKKLKEENWDYGTPEDAIREMCLEWLAWDSDNVHHVASLLLVEGTNSKNAYMAMENDARSSCNGRSCVKLGPVEALTEVMKYYGVTEDKAHAQLEGGLMYHLIMAEAKKYQPCGVNHSGGDEFTDGIDEWAARKINNSAAKATPVSDFNFGDFDAELEGLL